MTTIRDFRFERPFEGDGIIQPILHLEEMSLSSRIRQLLASHCKMFHLLDKDIREGVHIYRVPQHLPQLRL